MNVVVDFETSGLHHSEDYPIQIGMVGLIGEKVLFEYERFILPRQPAVAKKTMWLTSISPEALLEKGYPPHLIYKEIVAVLRQYHEDLSGVVLHAWNCEFDRRFMQRLEELADADYRLSSNSWVELQPYPKARLDTCFSRKPIPAWFTRKFSPGDAHNGLVDCYRAIVSSPVFEQIAQNLDFSEVKNIGKGIRRTQR